MKIKFLIASIVTCLLASCSSDELSNDFDNNSNISDAQIYLNTHHIPDIMFSYSVLNLNTKELNSFIIDGEGKTRTYSTKAESLEEMSIASENYLKLLKDNSTVIPDQHVSVEELVHNFKSMRTAGFLNYDNSVYEEEPNILTAAYAYYYRRVLETSSNTSTSTTNGNTTSCTHGGSSYNNSNADTFESILLEQKIAGDVIQKNDNATHTINWLNNLLSASSMEFENN